MIAGPSIMSRRFAAVDRIAQNRNTYAKRQREQEKRQRADDKRRKRENKISDAATGVPNLDVHNTESISGNTAKSSELGLSG